MATGEGPGSMSDARERRYYLEIFLVSFAALLLEISYTRVFSYKIFYFFTYLIIGVALLGIGSGGIFISVFPRLRSIPLPTLVARCSLIGGTFTGLGYFVVAYARVNTLHAYESPQTVLMLFVMSLTLYVSYLCVGLVISALFAHFPGRINRLYFADLVGAGLSCALVIPLINRITPPGCVFFAGLILLATGVRCIGSLGPVFRVVYAAGGLFLALGCVWPAYGVDPVRDAEKMTTLYVDQATTEFSKWGAVFRLDIGPEIHPSLTAPKTLPDGKRISNLPKRINNHDGLAGSVTVGVTGEIEDMEYFDYDERALPFSVAKPSPNVLIIGAAGGHEMLVSLYFRASSVEGIELNPVTHGAITGPFADYTGRFAERPNVQYINAEGRSYLARQTDDKKYDIIYFVAPDSYAAMNAATAGAFVMAESYLYTVEAIDEALEHLADDGVLCMQFGEFDYERRPNRTARYLVTAREALKRHGIEDFQNHVLVATSASFLQLSTILLSKTNFDREDVDGFVQQARKIPGTHLRYPLGQSGTPHPVTDVILLSNDDLPRYIDQYPYAITPVHDDSPFFWHFVRFLDLPMWRSGNVLVEGDFEEAYGEQVMVLLLIIALTLAAVFLLLPLVLIRKQWFGFRYKLRSFVYFASLGLGFMYFEIPLIQKLTLYLGYPTYSLTVTLMAILIFSGLGSMLSERYVTRPALAAAVLACVLVLLTLFYSELIAPFLRAGVGAPLALRIAVTIGLVAPVGLTLGAMLPVGLAIFPRSSQHREAYIAWCWAINGFFSVAGSISATLLSMAYGFSLVMQIACGIYLVALVCLYTVTRGSTPAAA